VTEAVAAAEDEAARRAGRADPRQEGEKPLIFRDHRISIPVVVVTGGRAGGPDLP
jgi:hypothetical protein